MSMSDAEPTRPKPASSGSDLPLRIASALVLAPLAVAAAYVGGWLFMVFWGGAALVVFWEWTALVCGRGQHKLSAIGIVVLALAIVLAASDGHWRAIYLAAIPVVLVLGMVACVAIAPRQHRIWMAAGVPYAGAIGIAPIILRGDAAFGFVAIILLFAVVWATDIVAYFTGRAVGGPKLAPRLSPNKTWSGAVGGLVGAVLAAVAVVYFSGAGGVLAAIVIAIALSVVAQIGDLFESAIKRQFGAKDAGTLIPGHGGLMDRLDGFVAAAVLACFIGLLHGGIDTPARGLLIW
jgi:phosphatidate cytidylyltransferase